MRDSLNIIERIERYINNELTINERELFEVELNNNSELQNQVITQQEIQKTVQRIALRKQIQKVAKSKTSIKRWKWILSSAILLLGIAALLYSPKKQPNAEQAPQPLEVNRDTIVSFDTLSVDSDTVELIEDLEIVEPIRVKNTVKSIVNEEKKLKESELYDFNCLKTWVEPTVQHFKVNPAIGGAIEGDDGTLVIIPENAFVDSNGVVVKEVVDFELVEALTLEDMVLYNLATTSNGKLLETGGMLYVNAKVNGKAVLINTSTPLYIEVPTDEVKKDMMAFEGEISEDGKLNWVNPKPLKKYLTKVPLNTLDFLPAGFSDAVTSVLPIAGHSSNTKELSDSLYYSLAKPVIEMGMTDQEIYDVQMKGEDRYIMGGISVETKKWDKADSLKKPFPCGIHPSSIQAILDSAFANSYIATKEFENRISLLHKESREGEELLKIYISNIQNDLWVADSLVADKATGATRKAFKTLSREKLSNVKDSPLYSKHLQDFYKKRRLENIKETNKKNAKLAQATKDELTKLKNEYLAIMKSEAKERNSKRISQLRSRSVVNSAAYSFAWTKAGWANIDMYLGILSKGSKKVILEVKSQSEETEVFQWLNVINTLNPLVYREGEAFAFFPKPGTVSALRTMKTYCLGIGKTGNNYEWFKEEYNPYKVDELSVEMISTSISDIRKELRSIGQDKEVLKYVNGRAQRIAEEQKRRKEQAARDLRFNQLEKRKSSDSKRKRKLAEYNEVYAKSVELYEKRSILWEAAFTNCFSRENPTDKSIQNIAE